MKKQLLLITLIAVTLACQVVPTPPPLKSTPRPRTTATRLLPPLSASPTSETPAPTAGPAPGIGAPFPAQPPAGFAPVQPVDWTAGGGSAAFGPELPVSPERIANPGVIGGLSLRQRSMLLQDGFAVVRTGEPQFAAIRDRVADRFGQPYYLTTDAAARSLSVSMEGLRLALEREEMHRRLIAVVRAVLDETLSYLPFVAGGSLEPDVLQAAIYLGTGLLLLDPETELPAPVADLAARQARQVQAAGGVEDALLIPGYRDDFSAFRPQPPYAGDTALEAYSRGRAWFGRAALPLDGPSAGRVPLILTMALRRAQIPPEALASTTGPIIAVEEWARLAETLAFLEGSSASYGPRQVAALMDQVYGPGVTIVGLRDAGRWEELRRLAGALPPAQLGGAPQNPFLADEPSGEWRFLPQGVSLDDSILGFLAPYHPAPIADKGTPPTALELAAVLGSQEAHNLLLEMPERGEPGYVSALARAQTVTAGLEQSGWGASADGLWLQALAALASPKDDAYAPLQRTPAWQQRELSSLLGAWAARRSLPARIAGSDVASSTLDERPASAPPPAFVEPDPVFFYRLSHLAAALVEGLSQRGLTGVYSTDPDPEGLRARAQELLDLSDRLQRLGDLAARELSGEALGPDDWALITAPLGAAEQRASGGLPPIPGLVLLQDSSGAAYAAAGLLDRLYVLVPAGEQVYVAQGGVYSFYEFPQSQYGPIDSPADWERLLSYEPVAPPTWAQARLLPEGAPLDVLAYHAGDVLRVTRAGGGLHVRAEPGRAADSLRSLSPGDTLTLLEGEKSEGGMHWRQVRLPDGLEGWVVEDAAYYERI